VGCRASGTATVGVGRGEGRDLSGRKTPREGRACGGGGRPKRNLFTIPESQALLILSLLAKLGWESTVP